MLKLKATTVRFMQRILLLAFFLVFGLVLTNQYLLYRQVGQIKEGNDAGSLTVRLSQLYDDNEKLKQQLDERTLHNTELEDAMSSSSETQKLIEKETNKYQVILGLNEVEGPGVKIFINHQLAKTQLVDFMNALRNSGSEAVAINQTRVLTKTPMNIFENKPNYIIEVIGDQEILYSSLTRPGGILELIANGDAQKVDNLVLPKELK